MTTKKTRIKDSISGLSPKAQELIETAVEFMEENGYGWAEAAYWLDDGEALARAGITDEEAVEEAWQFVQDQMKKCK